VNVTEARSFASSCGGWARDVKKKIWRNLKFVTELLLKFGGEEAMQQASLGTHFHNNDSRYIQSGNKDVTS